MVISIIGGLGVRPPHERLKQQRRSGGSMVQVLSNRTYLYYLLIVALYSGIGNTGHTYIPSMLEYSGLSVNLASTVVALSVICEAPLIFFSYLFMDRISIKKLLYLPLVVLTVQYLVYGLDLGLTSKVIMTLVAKHTTGMLLIMVTLKIVSSLVDQHYLVTAIALVQTVRSLGTILIQNIAGNIIDQAGYESMSFFLVGLVLAAILLSAFLRIPESSDQKLFS